MISALNVDKLRLDMGEYVLSVTALHKQVGGVTALRGVDLDVKRGACIALVGPQGSGKSITLACISGALRPDRGRIRYFGYEIRGRGEERVVRMGVARTHQRAQNFGGLTVLETATIGALLRRSRIDRAQLHARAMLALTGLTDRSDVRVERLDALERRQLDIARALATDPQLLLLDDVMTGLAGADVASLVTLLAAVRARGTTIVAAARSAEHLSSLLDDVVEINRGKTADRQTNAVVDFRF